MRKLLIPLLALALLLSGCSMQTVDKLYRLPKRSEQFNNLQAAIDRAMGGLSYCAPLAGENQQTVQMADLDGDGLLEYLVFAKGTTERPLQILIFRRGEEDYELMQTIESYGSAFDQVEYVQMDGRGGQELVVGRQLSDQVLRSVSVYDFSSGQGERLVSANYTKYLCSDLNSDGNGELFLLRSGDVETDNGVAEFYAMANGSVERSPEVSMSEPVDHLKRILQGCLNGGLPAVYVASAVEENTIVTDVYAIVNGEFKNISFSNDSGTSVQTLRNYYVYADDIDDDGIVELPDLITMPAIEEQKSGDQQYLIRWYAMGPDGSETDKMYTYHNFLGGWYLELDGGLASRTTVVQRDGGYVFYLWDTALSSPQKVLTVYAFSGQDRAEQAASDGRFVLYSAEAVTYCAKAEGETDAESRQALIDSFHLIRQEWKTGET